MRCCLLSDFFAAPVFIIYISGIFPDFYPFLDENIENEYKNCSVTCTAVLF